ncbi:MAG: efflux RND transporter periplasmic adaptor subunit [Planctomycetes bacterium]|nr:efflux RND transporter periplasmic adaptor subunit [Planctomycetota bacterium]
MNDTMTTQQRQWFANRRLQCALLVAGLAGASVLLSAVAAPAPIENELPVWNNASVTMSEDVVLSAIGRSEPRSEERTLSFSSGGLIERFLVDEGQPVKAGQVLAVLEHSEQAAAASQAQADVAAARAELARVEAGPKAEVIETARLEAERAKAQFEMFKQGVRGEERDELEASYKEAQARADAAQRRVERLEPAYRAGGLPKDDLIRAQDEAAAAVQSAKAAKARMEKGRAGYRAEELQRAELAWKMADLEHRRLAGLPRAEDVAVARCAVQVAEARLEAAQAALAKTNLCAPCQGTVLQILAREGERVEVIGSSPVLVMGDLSEMWLRVEVDENDVGRLMPGQAVVASARGLGRLAYDGSVARIGHRMGRKRLFTDLPGERVDTKVLEVWVRLNERLKAPVGYRFQVEFLKSDRLVQEEKN